MAVDPNLSLQTTQPNIGGVVNDAVQQQNQSALTDEQVLKAHLDSMGERDKQRLQSTVVGAAQLKTYLDKGDVDGAHDFLMKRQASLHQRMANGEEVDDQETAYALDKLRRGDLQGLTNDVNSMAAAGQAYGMIGGQGTPSSVQEWNYYHSLPKDQQDAYLTMKRANPGLNLGGTTVIPSQSNPAGAPQAVLPHTLKPEDQPVNAGAKSAAQAAGTTQGTNAANADASLTRMGGLTKALQDLQTSGKKSPGGVAANLGATVANQSGFGGGAADAQGDFTVKRAAAENAIREAFRVAGSGAQSDADALPFIQMLPNADDADSVKVSKINAALQAVQNKTSALMQQRGLNGQPQGGGAQPGAAPAATVKISNGKETYVVTPEDAAAAAAEGFKQVQ